MIGKTEVFKLPNASEEIATNKDENSSVCMSTRLNAIQRCAPPLNFEIRLDLKSLGTMVVCKRGVFMGWLDKNTESILHAHNFHSYRNQVK